MLNNIAVTGIGIATSYGKFVEDAILNKRKQEFDKIIDLKEILNDLNPRQLKKMDKFTALAVISIKNAFSDANVQEDCSQLGLIIGNVFGGWSYVEEQMYALYQGNFLAINPYVATAWFPAAPQGEASILYGYGGYSKTISADNLSAAYSIEHGISLIKDKKLKIACCGGVEAPLTPIIKNVCKDFSKGMQMPLADTSVFFCLEGIQTIESGKNYKFIIEKLTFSRKIDEVLELYKQEKLLINSIVNSADADPASFELSPKNIFSTDSIFGQTFGAAFALDIYVAYQAARTHQGKSFIIRKSHDGQYAACLISLKLKQDKVL